MDYDVDVVSKQAKINFSINQQTGYLFYWFYNAQFCMK